MNGFLANPEIAHIQAEILDLLVALKVHKLYSVLSPVLT